MVDSFRVLERDLQGLSFRFCLLKVLLYRFLARKLWDWDRGVSENWGP